MQCILVKLMVISVRKNNFFLSQPFLKIRKCEDFLMNNFYLAEILNEPNSLTIVTSKKIVKMSNYVKIEQLWIFFS